MKVAALGLQDLQVKKVNQAKMEFLVLLVLKEKQDYQALGHQEHPDFLGIQVQRVTQDFLVPPDLLDFLALKETVVILDVQVAQDNQDNQVSLDQPHQVLKETLDQQDLLDAQALKVLKVHLVQKVLAAPLAMAVTEVRKVILAALDNLDSRDQKETQEHQEYRVSREDQV